MSKARKKGFIKHLKNIFCCLHSVSDDEVYEPGCCVPSSVKSHETSPVASHEETEVASLEAKSEANHEMGPEASREVDAVDNREMSLVASQEWTEMASLEASTVENCKISSVARHEMGPEASRKVDPVWNCEISLVASREMSLVTSCTLSLVAIPEASSEPSPMASQEASQMGSHGPNPIADSGSNREADHGPITVVDREPSPAEGDKASPVASHQDVRAASNKAAECKGCQTTSDRDSPGSGSGQAAGQGIRRRRRGGQAARRRGGQHSTLGGTQDIRQKGAIPSTAPAIIRPTSQKLAARPVSDEIAVEGTENGFCMMCILERHTIATFSSKGKVIKPLEIVQNLKRIAKHLQFGKQEDVHEFFCCIVEALHLSCPINHHKPEEHVEKTSVVHQIFTGQLRSTVECTQCSSTSDRFENCLDISLHINNSPDLLAAFLDFTKAETLDEYTCQRCSCKVKATKRMSLHLPNVLALSIRRYDLFGNKINRICDGRWFRIDDDLVTPVDTRVVIEKQAYILFYIRLSGRDSL
ncbi:unnamed protein product [Lampetra fluviatilis]